MTDGPRHAARKAAIQAALASVNPDGIEQIARDEAARLIEALRPQEDPARVTAFAFQLPVRVVGLLLGIEPDDLAGLAASTGDFVRAVAPGGGVDDPAYGMAAADALRERIDALLARDPGPLFSTMWARMPREADEGCDVVVANAVGLLMQSYEATAGLIGNVLVALARYGAWPGLGRGAGGLDYAYVEEVLRFDAPVQNTRRYVAEDTIIAGRELRAGDAILVLLAAANRDPAANPAPHLFDPGRRAAQHYTFGAGVHHCPGSTIAAEIALEGVRALIAAGCSLEALVSNMTYVATPNVRIPLFRA
jgi:cytochrome P450